MNLMKLILLIGTVRGLTTRFFLQTYFERLFNDLELPMLTRHRDFLLQTATRADELTWSDWGIPIADRIREESMDVDTEGGYDGDDEQDYYDFKEYVIKDRDVAFFQITKPFTDLPYTLVVRDFSSKGYLPLFSGFYIEMSWYVKC